MTKKNVKSETELTWRDLEIGCIVTEPGSASQYQTGGWRSQKPIFDKSKCNKCGLCFIYCPEGCITQTAEGLYEPNMYYCKGCGICAHECARKAITIKDEEA